MLLVVGPVGMARAEGGTCPPGFYPQNGPGVLGCAPIPDGGAESVGSGPKWATRWGAIATDGANAAFGAASDIPRKRAAQKEALAQCKARGGQACKVDLVYYNQCAVMITGDFKYLSQGAESVRVATEVGMKRCGELDAGCRVYYSGCSLPVRIR
ncbi:protein of unknown function [Lysobacter sp. cf310]|nr:protein of unknown function [Lysobacter sp. cf310]